MLPKYTYTKICDLAERMSLGWPLNRHWPDDPGNGRLVSSPKARNAADRVVELIDEAVKRFPADRLDASGCAHHALGYLHMELADLFERVADHSPLERTEPHEPGEGDFINSDRARLAVCQLAELLHARQAHLSWVADILDQAEEVERLEATTNTRPPPSYVGCERSSHSLKQPGFDENGISSNS